MTNEGQDEQSNRGKMLHVARGGCRRILGVGKAELKEGKRKRKVVRGTDTKGPVRSMVALFDDDVT